MLSFEMDPRNVKEILINFGKYYDIGDEKIEELLKNLDEYVHINFNKSTDEKLENIESIFKPEIETDEIESGENIGIDNTDNNTDNNKNDIN
jgi:hypothetical protein